MTERNFHAMIEDRWSQGHFVCVGLDPDINRIPEAAHGSSPYHTICAFNNEIVAATEDLACAYKPNIAFYEQYGFGGVGALTYTVSIIRTRAPHVPVIIDAKRGDIKESSAAYASALFEKFGADAVTVNPYLGGYDALKPFFEYANKGVFVLCRTSNEGGTEFQDLEVITSDEDSLSWGFADETGPPLRLYEAVAYRAACEWNTRENVGLVVGTTYPDELAQVRSIVGDMPLLIPGIGAQGGDLEATVQSGRNSRGRGMIINSSSGIIYASNGPDFAEAARRKTAELDEAIKQVP